MSSMVEVKTAKLNGKALAWAVARANGDIAEGETLDLVNEVTPMWWMDYEPQEDWAQGGPLIEQHGISLSLCWNVSGKDQATGPSEWRAHTRPEEPGHRCFGLGCPTPLIAACRAIVSVKLGDTVTVPEALLETGK